MSETIRERVIRLVREMRERTVDRGCTPAEAAAATAKIAEYIERYQIEEAELRMKDNNSREPEIEICQNILRTGKKVFNPGMTQVVNGLSIGMCCKCIMFHQNGEAVYGIVGSTLEADYVCQLAMTLVPSLQMTAKLEGIEHGYEKAGLVRWSNQYLAGAAIEIKNRLEEERRHRSEVKQLDAEIERANGGTALAVITGESLAIIKKEASEAYFKELYPKTRESRMRTAYDHTAHTCGREAGKRVGLNIAIQ